MSPHMTSDP